jgi:hypothetical protein
LNKLLIIAVLLAGPYVFLFYAVCIPLSQEDLQSMNGLIEQRTDRDFYLNVLQKKTGNGINAKPVYPVFSLCENQG